MCTSETSIPLPPFPCLFPILFSQSTCGSRELRDVENVTGYSARQPPEKWMCDEWEPLQKDLYRAPLALVVGGELDILTFNLFAKFSLDLPL